MRDRGWGALIVVVAGGLVWLPACSGKPDSSQKSQGAAGNPAGGGSSATATDSDGFRDALAQGYCARLFRCFEGNDDFMTARLLLKTPEGCEAELRKLDEQQPGRRDLQAQVAAGKLHFDAAAASRCVAELSACNGVDSFTGGSCAEVYDGDAQTGEACQRDEDCAGDAYCVSDVHSCPGQCQPRKAVGEPCERYAECSSASGVAFCDNDVEPAGACGRIQPSLPKGKLGEPCSRRMSGQIAICSDELWCAADASQDAASPLGRCVAPLHIGDTCSDGDDVCVGGFCDTGKGVCAAAVLRSKAGEACDKSELSVCDPTLGLRCNEQGTCDASGDGSQGSACFNGDFQRGCGAGLYCATPESGTAGICEPRLAAGAACTQSSACESGECNTTCQPRYCEP